MRVAVRCAGKSPFKAVSGIRAAPVLVDKTLVLADEDGNVYGLDSATGNEKWSQVTLSGVTADLLVEKSTVYISAKSGDVFAVDSSDGSITALVATQ